jgi:hypothetical protein
VTSPIQSYPILSHCINIVNICIHIYIHKLLQLKSWTIIGGLNLQRLPTSTQLGFSNSPWSQRNSVLKSEPRTNSSPPSGPRQGDMKWASLGVSGNEACLAKKPFHAFHITYGHECLYIVYIYILSILYIYYVHITYNWIHNWEYDIIGLV